MNLVTFTLLLSYYDFFTVVEYTLITLIVVSVTHNIDEK